MAPASKFLQIASVVASVFATTVRAGASEEYTIFDRPGGASQVQAADPGDAELGALQLTGISALGGKSMFNFVDTRNNKSFWVPLEGTVNGISVQSYDAASDTVVVVRGSRSRPLKLRQAKIASMPAVAHATPAVASPPRTTAGGPNAVIHTPDGGEIKNPKTPQEIAQAETEARMLVSDLLEISMQERARQKALREAQQKQQLQQQGGAKSKP